jgi:HAD superfamily hydrolase (TIGR01490 family)
MEIIFSEDSNINKKYAAFFDLDHTIIKEISGKALVSRAYRKGLINHSDLAAVFYTYLLFKFNIRAPLKVIDNMVGWVKGIPEEKMGELCSEVFSEILLPSVFGEARAEIIFHKKNSAKVVILSSGINPICQEVSKSLEMDDILCSSLEVKDGYLTGRPLGQFCFGEEKVVRLNDYCNNNNVNPHHSWYYGDSVSDIPVLSIVGNPVCVNPGKNLKKAALQRGWKILYWHH